MAHVLTYWRHPDEEARFVDYLEKTGDILACTEERMEHPDSEKLEPRPLRQLLEELNPRNIFIGPREFMDMAPVIPHETAGRGVLYGRFYMDVPLVSYSRGVFRGTLRLGGSNLLFVSSRATGPLGNTVWTPQPPEFIAWGKRVLGWARRHAPRVVNHKRMTERVFAELENGLELVP